MIFNSFWVRTDSWSECATKVVLKSNIKFTSQKLSVEEFSKTDCHIWILQWSLTTQLDCCLNLSLKVKNTKWYQRKCWVGVAAIFPNLKNLLFIVSLKFCKVSYGNPVTFICGRTTPQKCYQMKRRNISSKYDLYDMIWYDMIWYDDLFSLLSKMNTFIMRWNVSDMW